MKNLRIELDDELYNRIHKLCTHHGQLSHLIRVGIRLVCEREEQRLPPKEVTHDTYTGHSPVPCYICGHIHIAGAPCPTYKGGL